MSVKQVLLRLVMTVGAIGGLAGGLIEQGYLAQLQAVLPPKYAAPVGMTFGALAAVAAYLHDSPLPKALAQAVADENQAAAGK